MTPYKNTRKESQALPKRACHFNQFISEYDTKKPDITSRTKATQELQFIHTCQSIRTSTILHLRRIPVALMSYQALKQSRKYKIFSRGTRP